MLEGLYCWLRLIMNFHLTFERCLVFNWGCLSLELQVYSERKYQASALLALGRLWIARREFYLK